MMNKTCCSVDDAFGFKGGVRGGEAKPWRKKNLLSWRVNRIFQGEFAQVLAQKTNLFEFPKKHCILPRQNAKNKKTQVKHTQKQHAKKQNRHETCISNKIPLKNTANSAGPFRHPPPSF